MSLPRADAWQASCDGMRIQIGRPTVDAGDEQESDYHLIAVPLVNSSAVISYRDIDGAMLQALVSDRHISLIPAGHRHRARWPADAQCANIFLSPEFLHNLAQASGMREHALLVQYAALDPLIWHMARAIERQMLHRDHLEKSYMESIAIVLGQHLLSTYVDPSVNAAGHSRLPIYKVRRAIDYIRAHYREEIGFKDIAEHLGMSPFHFARMFKRSTNDSPHQFIMRCRIDAAKRLLIESDRSIADIAFEVGYKNQSHFTTGFARLAGTTPAAFRIAR